MAYYNLRNGTFANITRTRVRCLANLTPLVAWLWAIYLTMVAKRRW